MTVKEYFKKYLKDNNAVTFIIAKAEKDKATPFYHPVYNTTSILNVWEWLETNKMDYIVLNDKQSPIDWLSGSAWNNAFKRGDLTCMLIISREEFYTLYSQEQADSMEKFIDNEIAKRN